jgi:molybdopterin converting factor small subunit
MSLKVVIPTPLRKFTSGAEVVEIEAKTVQEALDILDAKFPGFRASVCDESGSLRRFINVYLDGEDVRFLENLATPVNDGSEIAIVPAISGGLGPSLNYRNATTPKPTSPDRMRYRATR